MKSNKRQPGDKGDGGDGDSDDDNISVEGDTNDTPMVSVNVAAKTEIVEDHTQQEQMVTDSTGDKGTDVKTEQLVASTHPLTAPTEPQPSQQEGDDDDNKLSSITNPSAISAIRFTDEENDMILKVSIR